MRRLFDIDLDEVSLVDMPAIKRKFLIVKKLIEEEDMGKDTTLEEIGSQEDTEVEKSEDDLEKRLSEKAANAIKGVLKMLQPYVKEFSDDAKAAVKVLAGEAGGTEKAGRRFSSITESRIRALLKAAKELAELIGEEAEETQKSEIDVDELKKYISDTIKEKLNKEK